MAKSPLIDSDGVVNISIASGGDVIASTTEIIAIDIVETVNRITTATISMNDGDMPNQKFPLSDLDTFKPGSAIEIKLGYGSKLASVFSGIIVKHAITIGANNSSRLVIECKDSAVKMTVGRKNANFLNMTDSDIISQLIGNYAGLSADVTATTISFKELVQFYCSDWDFLIARAEANGMLVTLDAGKVNVGPPVASAEAVIALTYGMDIMSFHAELDARTQYKKVRATSWDLATLAINQQQATPTELTGQGNIPSSKLTDTVGLAQFDLQHAVPMDADYLSAWAKAQQLKAELSRIRGHVSFQGSSLVKAGTIIELNSVGDRFNGKVFVSAVHHSVSDGNWITQADFGMSSTWFTEAHEIASPSSAGLNAGVNGLHIGIVMKLDADPEAQYKIQVSIPLLQAATDGFWARLGQFYASNSFGAFFIPEIGDEVILGFFNDDPSHPVILGSLYSSKNKPAYELTADNFTKAIVTKSKLKMEFDDDKKIITLVTPQNNTIVINDDQKSILLQDQTGNKVELNSSGIILDSPKDIAISAKGKITLDAVGNVEINSKADVKETALNIQHTANIGFTAKGSASAEVSASGTTTIKGAMVMIN